MTSTEREERKALLAAMRQYFPRAAAIMQAQVDEARDVSAALADAYHTDTMPPPGALRKADVWLKRNTEACG